MEQAWRRALMMDEAHIGGVREPDNRLTVARDRGWTLNLAVSVIGRLVTALG